MAHDTPDPTDSDPNPDPEPADTTTASRGLRGWLSTIAQWAVAILALLFALTAVAQGGTGWVAGLAFAGVAGLLIPRVRRRAFAASGVQPPRWLLVTTVLLGVVVGVGMMPPADTADSTDPAVGDGEPAADQPDGASAAGTTAAPTRVTREDQSGIASVEGVAVRIGYSGTWSGALSTDTGVTRSIEGTGTEIIELEASASELSVVSVNAQKQDGGVGQLTVQVIHDREVVKQASTNAEYGVAQVSAEIDSGWLGFARAMGETHLVSSETHGRLGEGWRFLSQISPVHL